MRITKILWSAVPLAFLFAIALALWGPGPKLKPEVHVRVIAVKADPSDPDDVDRAKRKSENIYEYLEKGANFAELAINESEAPSAADGGDMGWVGRGVLPEHLEDIAFQLEQGQHSQIIEDHAGENLVYRILYVEERRNF